MKQNDYFLIESSRIIRENPLKGQYYVMQLGISDFYLFRYIYGDETGNKLLLELNDFLYHQSFIRFCHCTSEDLILCLCFFEEGQEIERMIEEYDKQIQPFISERQSEYLTCSLKISCGICLIENGDMAKAVTEANIAREISQKHNFAKTYLYSQSMKEHITALHENELEIYNALKEKRFCFYLQPKVDLTDGRIIGAEALARCIDKDGKIIYPDKFLEVMEANGSILDLDRLICTQVCAFLKDRMDKGLHVVCISVNLSRLHIQNPETASMFHEIAVRYHIPPEFLEFELTETILLNEFTGAKQLID